jgi:hypothetical protein
VSAVKDTNPKDMVGTRKTPLSTLPWRVLWRVGLAMLEGACKYGRHNYRAAGVRYSVYFDGTQRHLGAWWEGQDIDPDSQLNHIDKAIASLMVLRDSMLEGNAVDDRPPATQDELAELNNHAGSLIDKYSGREVTHYTIENAGARRHQPPTESAHKFLWRTTLVDALRDGPLYRPADDHEQATFGPIEQFDQTGRVVR